MGCNRDHRSEKTREMFHYVTKWQLNTNNGQAGVGFLINMTWKDHILRVNSISPGVGELVLCIRKCNRLKVMH